MSRYLVTWYDGNAERVSIVEPEPGTFPFGVQPEAVHPQCEQINVIVEVADDFEPTMIVIEDREAELST